MLIPRSKRFQLINLETIMGLLELLYPPIGAVVPVVSTLVICVFSFYMFKWLSCDVSVPVRDAKNHSWRPIKINAKAWYCSVCEALLLNGIGVYCDCCGVFSDTDCVKKANVKLKCKIVTSSKEIQLHHWVKGNLPLGSDCDVCTEECSMEPGLVDYQCCWCQRTVHSECKSKIAHECDFGPFRDMIVPPWCVQVAKRKGSFHKYLLLRGVRDPNWKNWTPLIVVANRKSGSNDGATVLSEFRKYLNPVQVIDLADRKPTAALQWAVLLAPKVLRVLVGGGDGTVAWVLTTVHKLDLEPEPLIAILPLGTGNDLSRVLGWGKQNPSELDVQNLLNSVQNARPTSLDRWKLELSSTKHLGLRIPNKTVYMYNYLGIGVDAQVALDFHKTRDSAFYIFGSRIFNKILYLCFGTQQVVASDCKNLEQRVEVFLDGGRVDLPELESVVVLNISSWGAGVDLWGMSGLGRTSQACNDGVLEVLGIYSSFHMAQLQVGLSAPHVIGQAKNVEIRLKQRSPIQVDGEPWEQQPARIKISLVNKATVLTKVQ